MDQLSFMTLVSPFSYHLKLLPAAPIQRFYLNSGQIDLGQPTLNFNRYPDYNNMSVQQNHFQRVLLFQQKQLQDLFLSKIAEQNTKTNFVACFLQEDREEQKKTKIEEITCKTEENSLDRTSSSSHIQLNNTSDSHKDSITQIINYFLSNFGKVGRDEIEKLKKRYAYDTMLTQLLNALIIRYRAASKSREDMVRFVIRKSLTWLRDRSRDRSQMSVRDASVAMCHRYFIKETKNFQHNKEILSNNDDELLSFLLPYKKNSRHPVVNSCFIREIFRSTEFCQDYAEYLTKYPEIMERENEKKIKQFTEFLMSCIQENCLHKVLRYKRIPWLNLWIEMSQGIGYEIFELNVCKDEDKDQVSWKIEKHIKTK